MSAIGLATWKRDIWHTAKERTQLAKILDTLPPDSKAIEQMCADEAEARLAAYERGKIEAVPGEEAIAWLNEQSSH